MCLVYTNLATCMHIPTYIYIYITPYEKPYLGIYLRGCFTILTPLIIRHVTHPRIRKSETKTLQYNVCAAPKSNTLLSPVHQRTLFP